MKVKQIWKVHHRRPRKSVTVSLHFAVLGFWSKPCSQVARGEDWQTIISDWEGKINEEGISEAVRIASEALIAHESVPAPEPEMVAD